MQKMAKWRLAVVPSVLSVLVGAAALLESRPVSAAPFEPAIAASFVPFGSGGTLSSDIVDGTGAQFMWYRQFEGDPLAVRFRNDVDFGDCALAFNCSAPLLLAADDYAAVFVNGTFAGEYWLDDNKNPDPAGTGPIPGQPAAQPRAIILDLAPFVTNAGLNTIEILACDAVVRPSPEGAGCLTNPAARGNHWVWLAGGVSYPGLTQDLDYVSNRSWLVAPVAVPAPSVLALLGAGLLGLAFLADRHRRLPEAAPQAA